MSSNNLHEDANRPQEQDRREELRARADSRRTVAAIAGVTGGALLVAGALKLAFVPRRDASKPAAAFQLGLSHRGLVVSGRF